VARRQLTAEIAMLDQQLQYQYQSLRVTGRQRLARLHRVSVLQLLGSGFAAGLLAGRFAAPGYRLYGVYRRGFRLWSLLSVLLSLAGGQDYRQSGGEPGIS
jgi:hypothetical protein